MNRNTKECIKFMWHSHSHSQAFLRGQSARRALVDSVRDEFRAVVRDIEGDDVADRVTFSEKRKICFPVVER